MRRLAFACGVLMLAASAAVAAPGRVVSMNLCADELAMLLAAPGQLISVSYLARDPASSVMAEEAARYPVNRGRAEEIFLLRPDLVLAGSFTSQASIAMLRRLGVTVAVIEPAYSIAEARSRILEMGALLGRERAARDLLARFDAALAAASPPGGPRPTAALLGANGYASGRDSLAGDVLAAAGFENILEPMGLGAGGRLSLEELLMKAPDLVVLPEPYPGWSEAEEILRHPALRDRPGGETVVLPDRAWVCGTPALVGNLDRLVETRRGMAR